MLPCSRQVYGSGQGLHLGLLRCNAVQGEAALAVVQQAEVLVCLGDGHHICTAHTHSTHKQEDRQPDED